ncbi:hypothetical protein [Achromobacter sp.]|uniref:hypothetical protein n=1 Tax=Achromobacter sp. TaxID=134375 RepID=UPI003C75B0C2
MTRRLLAIWRRARRAGRDLDLAAYGAGVVGGTVFLAFITGGLGPSLDAAPQAVAAAPYSANAASAAHAPN